MWVHHCSALTQHTIECSILTPTLPISAPNLRTRTLTLLLAVPGVDRIYLYDHNSTERMSRQVQDYIDSGYVVYHHFTGHHKRFVSGFSSTLERFRQTAQGYAYGRCVRSHSKQHTFMGFIDLDEFLVVRNLSLTGVNQFLQRYEDYGGVSVHWRVVGSSGVRERPSAPVVQSYTQCMPMAFHLHKQFKTFVNTGFGPVMQNPHRPFFSVDRPNAFLVDERFQRIKKGLTNRNTQEWMAVYHYVTKSWEDFSAKLKRGGGAGVTRVQSFFDNINRRANVTCLDAITSSQKYCK